MRMTATDAIKFGILAAVMAMFLDAAIGHGLYWRNDPYWSYWITDTLLITFIVSIGTTIIGAGIWQGPALMAVQVLILETYYQFLSPVGLPQEPYWLSRFETWTSGMPVHFLVYLSGYLIALWIWKRKGKMKNVYNRTASWKISIYSLLTAVFIVLIDVFLTQLFLLGEYPGFTFLLQRLIISTVFLFVWNSHVGLDYKGIISATILLSLQWLTYTMYLGPIGLPTDFPRFLTYHDLWSYVFPGTLVSVLVGLVIMSRVKPKGEEVK